jgi:hypothetical protein
MANWDVYGAIAEFVLALVRLVVTLLLAARGEPPAGL